MQVAEPSQQLGLSPGSAAQGEAESEQQGAALEAAAAPLHAAPAPTASLLAATPAPAAAHAPADSERGGARRSAAPRLRTGAAEEWHALLRDAKQLVEEIERADPHHPAYQAGPGGASAEEAHARYQEVVSLDDGRVARSSGMRRAGSQNKPQSISMRPLNSSPPSPARPFSAVPRQPGGPARLPAGSQHEAGGTAGGGQQVRSSCVLPGAALCVQQMAESAHAHAAGWQPLEKVFCEAHRRAARCNASHRRLDSDADNALPLDAVRP